MLSTISPQPLASRSSMTISFPAVTSQGTFYFKQGPLSFSLYIFSWFRPGRKQAIQAGTKDFSLITGFVILFIFCFSDTKPQRTISLFLQHFQVHQQLNTWMCLGGILILMRSWGSRNFLLYSFVCVNLISMRFGYLSYYMYGDGSEIVLLLGSVAVVLKLKGVE